MSQQQPGQDPLELLEEHEGPKDEKIDLESLDRLIRFQQKKTVAYKTVDTFAGITRKRLWLKNGPEPATNGHEIRVPFSDPNFYRLVEEQLAHILFRTDPKAKKLFVSEYVGRIEQISKKMGQEISPHYLHTALTHIITLLERRRIGSLWGRLYQGSYEDMREIAKTKVQELLPDAHKTLLGFITCLEVDPENIPPGDMDKFRPFVEEAFRKVNQRGFASTLVVSKWLVMQMVNQILRDQEKLPPLLPPQPNAAAPPQEKKQPQQGKNKDNKPKPEGKQEPSGQDRTKALQDLLKKFGNAPDQVKDSVEDSKFQKGRPSPKAQAQANQAIKANVNDEQSMEELLESTEDEMDEIVQKARKNMRQELQEDDWLQKDAMAKIRFLDEDTSGQYKPFPAEDERTVMRLRSIFHRVEGRRKATLEDAGVEVDVGALIERRLTGIPVPVFKAEGSGKGFRAILLIDRSGSMEGQKTVQCERAARIIQRALRFPYVSVEVWGFTSQEAGEVVLTRFDPHQDIIMRTKGLGVGGLTPIHIALRVAGRRLSEGTESTQCFLLTDGFPSHRRRDGKWFNSNQLMGFVRDESRSMRKNGTNVTCVMLGERFRDPRRAGKAQLRFDVTPKQMQFMFGSSKNWRFVDPEHFDRDLVHLVASSFVNFLRHR
jgi:hypothetical protein